MLAAAPLIRLTNYGMLSATGGDARSFLHAQLTNSIEGLSETRAVQAGWCSAKGRLLATVLVIPTAEGFLLQLARDLAPAVRKRLGMFILRSKVKLEDESDRWAQYGVQGESAQALLRQLGLPMPGELLGMTRAGDRIAIAIGPARHIVILPAAAAEEIERQIGRPAAPAEDWVLEDIRAGRPLVTGATQEMYVPQMLNLHELGAIDFKKGCYPGQEIVARTQYRGQLKRKMVYATLASQEALSPGQPLYSDELPGQESGSVVNAVRNGSTWELLAVVPVSAPGQGRAVRTSPGGSALSIEPGRVPANLR